MFRRQLAYSLLALGLALAPSGAALAAAGHAHGGHGAPVAEMTLDHGKKWQTDAPLRQGMSEIRAAMAGSLERIHGGGLSPQEFSSLGDRVQGQVDFMVANCKLPEAADAQLHLALEQILEGISTMKGGGDREEGAASIVQALNAYGDHFDHAGWNPLSH